MFKVLFENRFEEKTQIGIVRGFYDAFPVIEKFCADQNYTIHYTRVFGDNGHRIVDVGSHSEFFYIEKVK